MAINNWWYGIQELVLGPLLFGTAGQLFLLALAIIIPLAATQQIKDAMTASTLVLGALTIIGAFTWTWAFVILALFTVVWNVKG